MHSVLSFYLMLLVSLRIAMDGLDNKCVLVYELIIPDFESSRSKELKKEEGMSTEPCLYQVGKQVSAPFGGAD